MTLGAPLVTPDHIEMGTVGGKAPTVVKRPEDLNSFLSQVSKKHTHMAIMSMKVMQVHHRRLDTLQLSNEAFGRPARIEAVQSHHAGTKCLSFYVRPSRVDDSVGIIAILLYVQDIVLHAPLIQQPADSTADLAGASSGAGLIDLNDGHRSLLSPHTRKGVSRHQNSQLLYG